MPTRSEDIEEMTLKIATEYGCKVERATRSACVKVPLAGKMPEFYVETFSLSSPSRSDIAFAWMHPLVQKRRNETREVVIRIKDKQHNSPRTAIIQWLVDKFPDAF